jgi:hypothetical protein
VADVTCGPSLAADAATRPSIVLSLVLVIPLAACGEAGNPGVAVDAPCRYVDTGECTAPAGSTPPAAPTLRTQDPCWSHSSTGVTVIGSAAEWDAQFGACTEVPADVDFATQRIAVATVWCTQLEARFVVETAAAVVIGVREGLAGVCIDAPIIVTLPRSPKRVRMASCRVTPEGDCQPIA